MTSKNPPADDIATEAEVEAAIRSLSTVELVRLGRSGERWAACLRVRGLGMDGDDLLQLAIERTLNGKRKWPKKVKLVTHLMQTMSSIASHPRKKHDAVRVSDDVGRDADLSRVPSPFGPPNPGPEVDAAAREQLDRLEDRFASDDEVGLVIEELSNQKTGPEIQRDLGISQREFETIMTRLRRGVDRKFGWRP